MEARDLCREVFDGAGGPKRVVTEGDPSWETIGIPPEYGRDLELKPSAFGGFRSLLKPIGISG